MNMLMGIIIMLSLKCKGELKQMIKTKKDAQGILDSMKEDNLTIEYTKDETKVKIWYDQESKMFKTITDQGRMKGNGNYPECTAIHLIFIDRKYINEQCKEL